MVIATLEVKNMNLTPKKDFQGKKDFAKAHADLVVSTPFREAVNAALLEQVLALPHTSNQETAAASFHEIMGARQFIDRLLNIAEMPQPPTTRPSDNLPGNTR